MGLKVGLRWWCTNSPMFPSPGHKRSLVSVPYTHVMGNTRQSKGTTSRNKFCWSEHGQCIHDVCVSNVNQVSNSEMKAAIITCYRGITCFSFWCSKSNAINIYLIKKKKERQKEKNEGWQQGCYHYVVRVFQKGDSRATEVLQKGDSEKTADDTDKILQPNDAGSQNTRESVHLKTTFQGVKT